MIRLCGEGEGLVVDIQRVTPPEVWNLVVPMSQAQLRSQSRSCSHSRSHSRYPSVGTCYAVMQSAVNAVMHASPATTTPTPAVRAVQHPSHNTLIMT